MNGGECQGWTKTVDNTVCVALKGYNEGFVALEGSSLTTQ